jgi:integrase/recombinase XerC
MKLPCHHFLEDYLHAYIDGCGLAADPRGALFRTIARGRGELTATPLPQANAYAMIRRRGDGEPQLNAHDTALRSAV